MKLLIEASPIEQNNPTGVNYFTEWLARGLEQKQDSTFKVGYFYLNFLGRKPLRNELSKTAFLGNRFHQIRYIPQRIYAKLVYYNVAPPLLLPKSDWVLFPNFYIWPLMRRSKRAVIIHDVGYLRFPEYVERKNLKFLRRVASRSIKKADLIVSNSQFTTSEIISTTGVSPKKIVTISIPVDTASFDRRHDKGRTRLKKRYEITKPYILSLGTLEPRKNLETTVLAYCDLPKKIRDTYSLVLAGKWGWDIDTLRDLIQKKQSEGFDIITPGHIDYDDKTTFFRNASFFVITSYYEGFGMPLLEALHCGIPSVAVDIPVFREVGGDACLWAARDAKAVASQLLSLITDPALAKKLSRAGRQRSSEFSWEKVSETIKQRLLDD